MWENQDTYDGSDAITFAYWRTATTAHTLRGMRTHRLAATTECESGSLADFTSCGRCPMTDQPTCHHFWSAWYWAGGSVERRCFYCGLTEQAVSDD